MTNIQDFSCQLMKSPRELASWNFPLQQILENYFNLLPEPSEIHYGEAALVIQNSVNAYVRRVEELYDETRCLSQKIISESNKNEVKRIPKGRLSRKYIIDLDQFKILDFHNELGKNITLKNSEEKPISFLHRCFSQLENVHKRFHIDILDIQGETIGKKYDYRCNQHMTSSGTLTEDFSLQDFSDIENENKLYPNAMENSIEINKNSIYLLNGTNNDCDKKIHDRIVTLSEENFIKDVTILDSLTEQRRSSVQEPNCYDLNSIESLQDENCLSFNILEQSISNSLCCDILNENNKDQGYGYSDKKCNICLVEATCSCCMEKENQNNQNEMYSCEIKVQNQESEIEENLSDSEALKESYETAYFSDEEIIEETDDNNDANLSNSDKLIMKESELEESGIVECTYKRKMSESEYAEGTLDNVNSTLKRCKRFQETNENKGNTMNDKTNLLQPILFDDGIPKKETRSRYEFRLPCHISLLKHSSSRKKNTRVNNRKSRKTSKPVLKSKNQDEEKSFKEDENQIESSFSVNYEPEASLKMDFLNFHSNSEKKNDSHFMDSERMSVMSFGSNLTSRCSSPILSVPSIQMSSLDLLVSPKKREEKKFGCGIEKLVKYKIKKIHEELDLHTDEDQSVAKWHEEIKPKLLEAERKPPFRIHEYESRIIQKLESCHRKLQFDEIIRKEPPCEVARYFSAMLQLASRNNLNITTSKDLNESIELVLLD